MIVTDLFNARQANLLCTMPGKLTEVVEFWLYEMTSWFFVRSMTFSAIDGITVIHHVYSLSIVHNHVCNWRRPLLLQFLSFKTCVKHRIRSSNLFNFCKGQVCCCFFLRYHSNLFLYVICKLFMSANLFDSFNCFLICSFIQYIIFISKSLSA